MYRKPFRCFIAIIVLLSVLTGTTGALTEKTVLLTFAGDITLGGKDEERNNPDSFDNVAKAKGYEYFFANFRDMFAQDDLTVANLEGPLTDNKTGKSSKKHAFRGQTDFARMLQMNGIEAVTLANNHTGDYGKQGETSTRKALEENGTSWFKDFTYYIFEKDGIKIAFFGLQNKVLYTQRPKFLEAVTKAREQDGANAIVICWHTGTEYKGFHEQDTEKRISELIEQGYADLVMISHSHTAQGIGIYQNRTVCYSLGNFVFGGNRHIRAGKDSKDMYAISLYAMVAQVQMTFSNEGRYLGQQVTIYPIFTSSKRPEYKAGDGFPPADRIIFPNDYQPMRLTFAQASDVYHCIERDSAFELPPMTERDGLAEIVFPYLPAFDGVMIPEDEESGAPVGSPEASSPKPAKDGRSSTQN